MLEMLLDKKLLFVLMGLLTGLGVVDELIGGKVYREYDDETYGGGGGKYE